MTVIGGSDDPVIGELKIGSSGHRKTCMEFVIYC